VWLEEFENAKEAESHEERIESQGCHEVLKTYMGGPLGDEGPNDDFLSDAHKAQQPKVLRRLDAVPQVTRPRLCDSKTYLRLIK